MDCIHYWLIEPAAGPTSSGVCRFCGAQREFHNTFPELHLWSSEIDRQTGREYEPVLAAVGMHIETAREEMLE